MDLAILDNVVVIQHEHELVGHRGELVEQRTQDRFDRGLGRLQQGLRIGADCRRDRL